MLAVVAGSGALPRAVSDAQAEAPLVCAYESFAPEGLVVDLWFRLETLGSLLIQLGEAGVTQVCFAGAIARPALDPTKLDAETAPLVPLFMEALKKGDDGALRVVQDLFERTGFEVLGAHELAPDLVVDGGVFSENWPDAQMREDGEVGAAYIAEMGPRDIGQSCLVKEGRVIAMEDAQGTDHLIGQHGQDARGGILFKGPKPGQNMKIDMPTLGPATIERAAAAGLRGLVVDAGDVILLEPKDCTRIADAHGLVLWARTGA